MLYSEKHQACVYQVPAPEQITAVIKTAKVIKKNTVAVPCGLWEMQVMRHMGFSAVSPMLTEYQWPGRFKPFDHQRQMAAFLSLHPRAFNLSDIGTGKTLGTLWAADYLMDKGLIRKALVLSPLSTVYRVWEDEIFSHFLSKRRCVVLHGTREQRLAKLGDDCDFYIINHDGLAVGSRRGARGIELGEVAKAVRDRRDINCIIVDEGSVYKDPNTLRYRVFRNVIQDKDYVWWLTGTPTPNLPTDAWAQVRAVRRNYMESYRSLQERTMLQVSHFKWVNRPEAPKIVSGILQPAVRFHRADCLDLPDTMIETRDVELTPSQNKALDDLKKKLSAVVGAGQINAVNEAALRMKLIQVCLGALYDEKHEVHKIDCMPRLKVLREIIDETGEKLLIFAPLTSIVNLIYNELKREHSCEIITGGVSASKRNEIFRAFQQEADPRIIVADPGTMAHGLTLTAASTIVWYGPTDKPELYTQANGRINRPGQTKSMLVVRLASTALEREIFNRLDGKQNMQGLILKLVKGEF